MNKLNESLLKLASQSLIGDDDVEGLAVNPDYHQAMVDGETIPEVLEDRFKEQEKEKEAFIKDTQKTDKKPKGTKEMKKMKLSESLFDDEEVKEEPVKESFETEQKLYKKAEILADNLSDFLNTTSQLNNRDDYLDEYDLEHLGKAMDCLYDFAHAYATVTDNEDVFESKKTCEKCGKDICECEKLEEATAVAEKPSFYYKKKRQPLADIIMRDLTSGEVVYKESQPGKYIATHAPSLNLDEYDIGANSDENGEFIIAWVETEEDTKDVEAIANKYGKQHKSGMDKYASGNKFFTKIYIDESEWDEPYFDPNAPLRPSKGKDVA